MPIRTALWTVDPQPKCLTETNLGKEQLLEEMILAAPRLVSEEWLVIGRQEDTDFGGRIDLLGLAPDGSLMLVEIKRDRTPREVVAQALDYAAWVEKLKPEQVDAIYGKFAPGRSLAEDFKVRFGYALDEDTLNQNHQIIIVAGSIDESTERIVQYLNDRDIPINVLCFQVFSIGTEQLLSRTWLLDEISTQATASSAVAGPNEPWNGEFYCSFGAGGDRSWEDAIEFGFISAGGGAWYSRTLQLLNPGDRVWVKVPDCGFVGVGIVTGKAQPASTFKVTTPKGEVSILEFAKRANYHREFLEDPVRCEHFVPVQWLETVPKANAIYEVGLFGNQNSVCQPTTPKWRSTVERLKQRFPSFERPRVATAFVGKG